MKPILFSTKMLQAILAGNKTQTRREIKHFGNEYHFNKLLCDWGLSSKPHHVDGINWEWTLQTKVDDNKTIKLKCPYGKIGDVLWVRETFCLTQPFDPETYYFGYRAGGVLAHSNNPASEKYDFADPDVWKPSIFMPFEACRLFLEVTDIRVERLQDISEQDAKAEGIKQFTKDGVGFKYGVDGWNWSYIHGRPCMGTTAKIGYEILWESINGKGSWGNNPYVWVIEFKIIDKPVNN